MDIDSQYVWVVAKFQAFKKYGSAFANVPLAMEANIPPYEWWDCGGTHLAPLTSYIVQVHSWWMLWVIPLQ